MMQSALRLGSPATVHRGSPLRCTLTSNVDEEHSYFEDVCLPLRGQDQVPLLRVRKSEKEYGLRYSIS